MAKGTRFPREVRDRAVRMVLEHRDEYANEWQAICSIAEKFGASAETVRKWVRQPLPQICSPPPSRARRPRVPAAPAPRQSRRRRAAGWSPTR
jgi:transposase-like protein